jgi:hypothetical protein
MVRDELTEASKSVMLEALKRDLFSYIEENTQKIDSNLTVFFSHVVSRLDDDFSDIDDKSYDEFIDAIAFHVMDVSAKAVDLEFIDKIISNAIRFKRKSKGKAILNILSGLKLMKVGKYENAINSLKDYWKYDARIGFDIAYCYLKLAEQEKRIYGAQQAAKPSAMELAAREQLLELARIQPPIFRLRQLNIKDDVSMNQAFWRIIDCTQEWFPEERWFIKIGLKKAKDDNNEKMRVKLLKQATEQFYDDLFFLRELYYYRLENRDGAGAAGIVKQMMQQHPQSLEPIYYGIKLSLISTGRGSYSSYRKLALENGMPHHLIQLLDLTLLLMKEDEHKASIELKDLKKRYPQLQYYFITLEYLAYDMFNGDEREVKRAKKTILDSLDHYALQVMKIQD